MATKITMTQEQLIAITEFLRITKMTDLIQAEIDWSDTPRSSTLGRMKRVVLPDGKYIVVDRHLVLLRHDYPVEVYDLE